MAEYKNVRFLLRAYRAARERGFDGRLLLVGGGRDLDGFRRFAQKLGIADGVVFTGRIEDRDEARAMYEAADLFVIASVFDNDPLVLVEAACMGVPALAIRGAGCGERIKDGFNGKLCALDVDEFAENIVKLTSDLPALKKLGENARATVPTRWRETAEKYIEIINALSQSELSQSKLSQKKLSQSKRVGGKARGKDAMTEAACADCRTGSDRAKRE